MTGKIDEPVETEVIIVAGEDDSSSAEEDGETYANPPSPIQGDQMSLLPDSEGQWSKINLI